MAEIGSLQSVKLNDLPFAPIQKPDEGVVALRSDLSKGSELSRSALKAGARYQLDEKPGDPAILVKDTMTNKAIATSRILSEKMANEQVESSKNHVLQLTSIALLAQAAQAPLFLKSLFE